VLVHWIEVNLPSGLLSSLTRPFQENLLGSCLPLVCIKAFNLKTKPKKSPLKSRELPGLKAKLTANHAIRHPTNPSIYLKKWIWTIPISINNNPVFSLLTAQTGKWVFQNWWGTCMYHCLLCLLNWCITWHRNLPHFSPLHTNRLLHRKRAVRIFIHKSQNFTNERVSIANEWVSKVLQRVLSMV